MMSRVGWIVAALVSVSSLGSAMAADIAVKAPPPPPVVPTVIYNWSGFYIGGELGGIWTRANGSFVFPPPATYSNKGSSGAGGGFMGYQYQFNHVVLGIEANVVALFSENLGRSVCAPVASCVAGATVGDRITDPIWSVGPRLGWAAGNWMPYLTGGYAGTTLRNTAFVNGVPTEFFSQTRSGWYAGAGVDWAVNPNWVVGVEYRHYDFGTARGVPTLVGGGIDAANTMDVSLRADSVMARASYKFNWAPALVGKY
jgi:outer membrane immunogenic protein